MSSQVIGVPEIMPANLDDIADVILTSLADNDILSYDSASSKWINVPAVSAPPTVVSSYKDANYAVLTADGLVILVGTVARTFTLPSSPTVDEEHLFKNLSTAILTIGRNGKTIDNDASDITLASGVYVRLKYVATGASTYTWAVLV